MATNNFTVDDAAYVEISTTDALVQNKSPYNLYVHFGTSAPAIDTVDKHVLPPLSHPLPHIYEHKTMARTKPGQI